MRTKDVKVNVDEANALAQQLEIQGVPTLLFFKGGKIQDSVVGLPSKDTLKTRLESLARVL